MKPPLAIDLYCGLGGWADGLLAEGWDVIGFDIEAHEYGDHRYPAQLVVQDVLTLVGSQFRNVDLIVGSSPCQEFSYRAMPWKRAKALPPPVFGIALFDAQFRIQREACEAAGRHIPLIAENVRGAQPWVGRARWNYGSFYLWGDVPALMPQSLSRKGDGGSWFGPLDKRGDPREASDKSDFAERMHGLMRTNGRGDAWFQDGAARFGSRSVRRKAASAMIAKIPLSLARHIGATFRP